MTASKRPERRLRAALSVLVVCVLAACASTRGAPRAGDVVERDGTLWRLERIDRRKHAYTVLPDGVVRVPARGRFALEREAEDHVLVRIAVNPRPAPAAPPGPPPLPASEPRDALSWTLHEAGEGLPRAGQWRGRIAVADLDGDGRVELIAAPPRMQPGAPRVFARRDDRWERLTLAWPPGQFDYGGAAAGDFDADGHLDLAFAMHLAGTAALRGTAAGDFVLAPRGLPQARDPLHYGSGTAALAVPQGGGGHALVLLRELGLAARPGTTAAPGLAQYVLRGDRWQEQVLATGVAGGDLVHADGGARCPSLLVAHSSLPGRVPAFARDGSAWRALEAAARPFADESVQAVAAGRLEAAACPAIAFAGLVRRGGRWQSRLVVALPRGDGWEERVLRAGVASPRTTALAVVGGTRPLLVVGDEQGGIDGYALDADGALRVLRSPPPDGLAGCGVTTLAGVDTDGDGRDELLATFASDDRRHCASGGGIALYRLVGTGG